MQGINRVDSWAQFVSLVQEARTRNQALSTGPAKIARRTVNQVAAAPLRASQPASTTAAVKTSDMPSVKMKALGSYFDAYA